MSSLIVLTLILPLAGAVGILGLSLVPRLRPYFCYVALAAVAPTTILILAFRWIEPAAVIPSLWQPSLLFGAPLILQNDVAMQPLAFALALAMCSAFLVELGSVEECRPRYVVARLALLAAGLVALWAANPLTMILGWAIYDLLQAAATIAAGGTAQMAIRGLIFGGLATLCLWGGTLLSEDGRGIALWSLTAPAGVQLALWVAAGVLRLWVYPFHLSAPDDLGVSPSRASLLLGPVLGWGLWLRLVLTNDGFLSGGTWLPLLAAISLAVGGFLAWSCKSPRSMLPWVGMAVTGVVLRAAGWADGGAVAVVAVGGVGWILGLTAVSLNDGLRRESPWWSIPAMVGALALLGIPFTLGFVTEATLLGRLAQGVRLGWGGLFFFGNLFLVPAFVRWLLSPSSSVVPAGRWLLVLRGVGLGLPALPLIVAGFYPLLLAGGVSSLSLGALFAKPGLAGWLLWIVSLAGGGVLAWQDGNVRPRIELLLNAAHDLLCLGWLYDVVVGALERGLSVLRAADEVVGGAGALLWSWLLFLLLLLVWSGK